MLNRALIAVFELLIFVGAIYAADFAQRHFPFIPATLADPPTVDIKHGGFYVLMLYFLGAYATVIVAAQFALGRWVPADSARSVDEGFVYLLGFSIAAGLIFATETIPYDLPLMIGICLTSLLFLLGVHIVANVAGAGLRGLFPRIAKCAFKRVLSAPGLAILLLCLSPGMLPIAFQ